MVQVRCPNCMTTVEVTKAQGVECPVCSYMVHPP